MNVEIRNEAQLDIAEGVAFYDRPSYGAGDYFYQRIFGDIESLSETAGIHEIHFGYHRKIATRHQCSDLLPIDDDGRRSSRCPRWSFTSIRYRCGTSTTLARTNHVDATQFRCPINFTNESIAETR